MNLRQLDHDPNTGDVLYYQEEEGKDKYTRYVATYEPIDAPDFKDRYPRQPTDGTIVNILSSDGARHPSTCIIFKFIDGYNNRLFIEDK